MNADTELTRSLSQIISYLEYLRFEFLRHLYMINTYRIQLGKNCVYLTSIIVGSEFILYLTLKR